MIACLLACIATSWGNEPSIPLNSMDLIQLSLPFCPRDPAPSRPSHHHPPAIRASPLTFKPLPRNPQNVLFCKLCHVPVHNLIDLFLVTSTPCLFLHSHQNLSRTKPSRVDSRPSGILVGGHHRVGGALCAHRP